MHYVSFFASYTTQSIVILYSKLIIFFLLLYIFRGLEEYDGCQLLFWAMVSVCPYFWL